MLAPDVKYRLCRRTVGHRDVCTFLNVFGCLSSKIADRAFWLYFFVFRNPVSIFFSSFPFFSFLLVYKLLKRSHSTGGGFYQKYNLFLSYIL